MKIEVANGGTINGLAASKRDMLNEKGYQVAFISTYNGAKSNNTRIIVKKAGVGEDLTEFFTDATVEVMPSLVSNETDIKIILGLDEK